MSKWQHKDDREEWQSVGKDGEVKFSKPDSLPGSPSAYPHVHHHPDSTSGNDWTYSYEKSDGSIGHIGESEAAVITAAANWAAQQDLSE